MPERLLQRTCQEATPGEYQQVEKWYVPGMLEPDVRQTVTFSCAPFQLPAGTELTRFCAPAASPLDEYGVLYIVRYDGVDGYTYDAQNNNEGCPLGCDLLASELTVTPETIPGPNGGTVRRWKLSCFVTTSKLPVTAVLNGSNQAQPQTIGVSPGEIVFYLSASQVGYYDVSVTDANNCTSTTNRVQVMDETGQGPGGDGPELDLKSDVYREEITDPQTGTLERIAYVQRGSGYNKSTHTYVPSYAVEVGGPENRPYSRDVNEEIDRYTLPDGKTLRQVYHDGNGGLRFVETVPTVTQETGELQLLNLIKTDIDDPDTPTGRLWAEASSPALPLSFTMAGPVTQTNATGQFKNLPAGTYTIQVTDAAGRTVEEEVKIEDRYRRAWWMLYDALDGVPMRLDLLLRDHTGNDVRICGNGEPLAYGWQGAGGDPTGNIPEAWGQTVDIILLDDNPEQFLRLGILDDRECRADIYRDGQLVFRGYIAPGTFRHRLLAGHQEISLLASCGLGALQNVPLLNHRGELLRGRRPLLSTLLHCLSRCDTNLPLYIASNLREASMSATDEPLVEAWAQRTAYGRDLQKPPRTKEALEAILRAMHAVLFQRNGAWWLESAMEVDGTPARRAFSQEGLATTLPAAPAVLHILPPDEVTGSTELYWVRAEQTREVVPAAAAVQSTVKLQLEENLLENGSFREWTPDRGRPVNWTIVDAPGLNINRVDGEKVGEYAAELLQSIGGLQGAILSSPVYFADSSTVDPVRIEITARVPAGPPDLDINGKDQAPPRIVRVIVRLLYDGVPEPETLDFEFTSADKRDTQSAFIPSGYGEKSVRVQVLPPVLLSGPDSVNGNQVRVILEKVALNIIPSLREWPDEDRFTATNYQQGYLLLDEVELTHADVPVLAGPNGLPLSAAATGVLAWRHALSTPEGLPTRAWARPGQTPLPLLERAATERMALRVTPGEVLTGAVAGPGLSFLGAGMMLDTVDADGKWWVVSCRHLPKVECAEIVLRKLSEGDYTTTGELTGRVRYTSLGPRYTSRRKYRTA